MPFEQIGVLNLIPVGSTVNKIVRRDSYMIDIILNYNKTTMMTPGTQDVQESVFANLVERVRSLIDKEFTQTGYFISSSQLYRKYEQESVYTAVAEQKGPLSA